MYYKLSTAVLVLAFMVSCSPYQAGTQNPSTSTHHISLKNNFVLPQRVAPPKDIASVELHPVGKKSGAPIIGLQRSQQLKLTFDDFSSGSRQFMLSISHRNKNWEKSSLVPNRYLNGFFSINFSGGEKSFAQNPTYYHYVYRFPNRQMQITKSGNYLLSIKDEKTGRLLFRIPFFVTENKGKLNTRIEKLFAQRQDGGTLAQPFSNYTYPNFVKQPQFDLSFLYAQNRFWGRTKETTFFDTATPGRVHFHLGRQQSFIADYEFYVLDLRTFQPRGGQIIDVQPGQTPPVITLRRDIQQFSRRAQRFPGSVLGLPKNDRKAQYGTIKFSLETRKNIQPSDAVYLTGDFNQWMIAPSFKMRYDSTKKQWKGHAMIKQGIYSYKYVIIKNNELNDLAIDRKFTNGKQEYFTFVYFQDPTLHFDRLLNVKRTVAR